MAKRKGRGKDGAGKRPEDAQTRGTWGWIFAFAGSHRGMYAASIALAVLSVVSGVIPYIVLAGLVRDLYGGSRDFGGYVMRVLVMLLFWCLQALFHGFSTALSHRAAFEVLGSMRRQCCGRLLQMPQGEVTRRTSGGLKNTLVERIDSIETTLAHVLPEFTSNLLAPVLIFLLMLSVDWRLALVGLLPIPVGLVCMMGMMKDYDASSRKCIDATKVLNDTAVEYIRGIEVIKVFGRTDSSYGRFQEAARTAADAYVSWMKRCNAYFAMAMSVMPAALIGILPVGGVLVQRGSLSVSSLIVCIILSLGLIQPLITVMSYTDDLAALRTVLGEVTEILTAPVQERPEASRQTPEGNTILLRDVHFGYDGREVLHGISLEIREGEMTALVGPSGSGKSTIAALIAGFYDVQEGSIRIGGADIRELASRDFYPRIAYVSQNAYLFAGTVRENIRMGRPGATDAEVEAAARAAGCHAFIMGLEKGYETQVGHGGSHLSGGERQRIAIARAMLKDAPVVILDEATAYMDPENEALVEESIGRLVRGKTLLVIAHRLSTVRDAAHLAVIEDGRICEEGTHESLLAGEGLYARMWSAHVAAGGRQT